MMSSSSGIKQEGPKMFSSRRILARDRSSVAVADASFRVYYSLGAGTVPFLWESKPGTPKSSVTPPASASSTAGAVPVPPISPPPSYQHAVSRSKANKFARKQRPARTSWPPAGWIIGWLSLNVRRRSPPSSSPTDHQQRCVARDEHGVVVVDGDDERRSPRSSTLCF
jgi:hypothetical protein